ncbi:MAG: R3H domain-containing nucleic acid-binding protein [Cyanobacteria bacterium J06632_3]
MEKSISWLETVLKLQGLKAGVSGAQTTGDLGDDSYWLTIDTDALSAEEIETLIGERGQVLDSIQYLANTILNMGVDKSEQCSYTIEVDGYRKKRQAALKQMAEEAAEEVLNNGKSEYELKGLSSAERRQLHGLLGEYENIETFSRGREPQRHLVVKLASSAADSDDEE